MRFSPRLESVLRSARVSGLEPSEWLVVESGISREEVKEFYLASGVGFVSSAIQDVAGLCRFILGPLVEPKRILGAPSRQEVLRRILTERDFLEELPGIRRLRRQRDFYKKLDRAIQSARMTYGSPGEREAQEEKLREAGLSGGLRTELLHIIEEYEAWLAKNSAWDSPRLLLAAIGALSAPEIEFEFPERIRVLSPKTGESRNEAFFEELAKRVEIERVHVSDLLGSDFAAMERAVPGEELATTWEAWHTVDDACDRLADGLLAEYRAGRLGESGVLLPDLPAIRRSLKRSLGERGLELRDPRDPTRLKWEESIKVALLPIDVVARRFRFDEVISLLHSSWVRIDADPEKEFAEKRKIHQEILDRGIRFGLENYSGDKLERIRAILELLHAAFSPRIRLEDAAQFHLAWIRRNEDFEAWVHDFFESVWERFGQDLAVIGDSGRRAPILYWLERLRLRLQDATPPFEKIQYENGVEIFRLGQTPLKYPEKLWCLALPPRYTTGESAGDYFYSDREREILSGHFQVRSGFMETEFRRKVLKFWIGHAREVIFVDANYDWDGRERESLAPLIQELGIPLLDPEMRHSHPRWRASYLHPKRSPPRRIALPPLSTRLENGEIREISATAIEHTSRCEMQGLLQGRWKARDAKPSDLDIRGDSRGTLLHEAVKVLVESRSAEGEFAVTANDALEEAWRRRRPKGLFQGERIARFTKKKLVPILETFMEAETKYAQRSRTRILALEEPKLRYTVDLGPSPDGDPTAAREQVAIVGYADRIDEHPDGLFIMDYKTSANSPTATQMVDLGYRLQLPIYAAAAANHFGKPAIGVQFVPLDRSGARTRGIFFKAWNGKEEGSLTNARSNNASLLDRDPGEVWGAVGEQVEAHTRRFLSGEVFVMPKQVKAGSPYAECDSCFVRDACGQRRFLDDVADDEDGDGGGGG